MPGSGGDGVSKGLRRLCLEAFYSFNALITVSIHNTQQKTYIIYNSIASNSGLSSASWKKNTHILYTHPQFLDVLRLVPPSPSLSTSHQGMDSRQFDKFCREAGYVDSKHGCLIETWIPGWIYTFWGMTSWVFFYYPGYAVGVMKLSRILTFD